jgi:hypothetical protein
METPIPTIATGQKKSVQTKTLLISVLMLSLFIWCSCSSKSDKIEQLLTRYADDDLVDQKEYDDLVRLIESLNLKSLQDNDGNLDHSKARTFLLKLAKKKNLKLNEDQIFQAGANRLAIQFNINVFLENSASMNGYVGMNSSFKTTIFKLLSDVRNFSSVDSLSLNYINSKAITIEHNASRDDIDDFYKRLNPVDFRAAGGNVASTDIEKMLKSLLDRVNENSMNVFISDCVFSPGKTNAKKFLDGQYAALYNDFVFARNNRNDLSVIVLQCVSKFEGTYYDYLDHPHSGIGMDRPYYIWFIGTNQQFKQLIEHGIFDLIKGGYKNKLVFESIEKPFEPPYKILVSNKIGSFSLKEGSSKGPITEAEPSDRERDRGIFGFNVVANYSKSLQDLKYFSDTTNYQINRNYQLSIESIEGNNNVSLRGFTHRLILETKNLRSEDVTIDVVGQVPQWVYRSSSNDDTKIEFDDLEMQRTFGFSYLIEGVADAFYPKSKSNKISTLNITIKK